MDIYLATGNAHKLDEFQTIFAAENVAAGLHGAGELGGMPDVDENADSFAGNAKIKACALLRKAQAGAWVLADDSGLQVDALDGAPGVHSARYAGPHGRDADNTAKLLRKLDGLDDSRRGAQFVCHLCLLAPDGSAYDFEGVCRGRIAQSPSGSGGFGYDPVFIPDGYGDTFAELGESVKNALSHRGKAVAKLVAFLKNADLR